MDDNFCQMCHHQHESVAQPQLYDVATTCRLLSISRATFYLLIKEGRIRVSKLGKKHLSVHMLSAISSKPSPAGSKGGLCSTDRGWHNKFMTAGRTSGNHH